MRGKSIPDVDWDYLLDPDKKDDIEKILTKYGSNQIENGINAIAIIADKKMMFADNAVSDALKDLDGVRDVIFQSIYTGVESLFSSSAVTEEKSGQVTSIHIEYAKWDVMAYRDENNGVGFTTLLISTDRRFMVEQSDDNYRKLRRDLSDL